MKPAAYELKQIVRRRGSAFQLQLADLCIPHGSVVALLGPTGSGKTTLLRLLTGLDRCEQGIIQYHGSPLDASSPLETLQQICLVPQNPQLLRGSVRWNLGYGLRARGKPAEGPVETVARQLGVAKLLERDARSLSGGQTQLVALGRALVVQPRVLLLDEPTANLDPTYVATVERAVASLRERAMTVIWSTHNLFQAKRVSERVAFLLGGELVETASTEEFFSAPADPRSRSFVRGELIC